MELSGTFMGWLASWFSIFFRFFFLLNMVYLVEMYLKTSVVLAWMVSFFFGLFFHFLKA